MNGVGDGEWLTLLQLHDSAFPIGAYAHSNGLERYAQGGMDPVELETWIRTQLAYGFGRLDLAATALAWLAEGRSEVDALADELEAWKTVPSLRATSLALGRRTLTLADRLWPHCSDGLVDRERPHHALVLGRLSRALELPLRPTLLAGAQGAVTAALAAATRCLALSPDRAQLILVSLRGPIVESVLRVLADPRASLWCATPGADVRAHEHASLTTRLFQS